MNAINIDFEFDHITENPLHIDVLIDGKKYTINNPVSKNLSLLVEYDDTKVQHHNFKLCVSGKRNLIESKNDVNAALEIKKINFDNLDVLPMITGTYSHNFNGYGEQATEEFTKCLGCDGVLEFNFYSPLSYWFSKHYPY